MHLNSRKVPGYVLRLQAVPLTFIQGNMTGNALQQFLLRLWLEDHKADVSHTLYLQYFCYK